MPRHIALKDPHRESRIYSARTVAAVLVVLGLLGVIMARYYNLQINDYQQYVTESERNRVQLQPLPPKRGLIYDRRGRPVAENLPAYRLELVPEKVDDLEKVIADLGLIIELPEDVLEDFERNRRRYNVFDSVPIKFNLSEDTPTTITPPITFTDPDIATASNLFHGVISTS